jgi:hypothetical protein
MKSNIPLALIVIVLIADGKVSPGAAPGPTVPSPVARWSFDQVDGRVVLDVAGKHPGTASCVPRLVAGVEGRALRLDGGLMSVPSAPSLQFTDATLSVAAWVNPYEVSVGQQMIVAKNVYSAGKREWGLMLDKDHRFRFYLWQKGWKKIASQTEPRVGHWHHVAVTVEKGRARLFVDGKQEAEGMLAPSLPATDAPLTLGGVQDGSNITQTFAGALDEVAIYRGVLAPEAVRAMADKHPAPHKIEVVEPIKLWSGGALPRSADVPLLEDVEFHVIKNREPEKDGCRWSLGVALAWHNGRLYASYGFNRGSENTATEEAHGRVSADGGNTWKAPFVIARGEGNLGISHGVFLSHAGRLWAFHGAFYDKFQRTHTRAYVLDEATGTWHTKGVVIDGGFWPLQEPQKMDDGNWIMAGARVSRGYDLVGNLPAVAISRGVDFTRWDLVVLPCHGSVPVMSVWGESTVIVSGARITCISRWNGGRPLALISESADYGRTWSPLRATNLPMAASKPYSGMLSTGQRYLVCTTTADSENRRSPLTIAVSRPGAATFSRIFVIRHAVFPEGPGASHPNASLCYPYAVEHDGELYVGYSVKSHTTSELAVIPLPRLASP